MSEKVFNGDGDGLIPKARVVVTSVEVKAIKKELTKFTQFDVWDPPVTYEDAVSKHPDATFARCDIIVSETIDFLDFPNIFLDLP